MSRYIDAEVLIHRFDEIAEGKIQRIVGINCESIEDKMSQIIKIEMEKGERTTFANFVNTIPTVDVVEVVHGEWSRTNNRPKTYIRRCSVCNMESYNCLSEKEYNYCPWCGAKMYGKKVE